MLLKACIFDLDGVVVDTAIYHYAAWRRLANELGFDFSEEQNERLKGVSRMRSLDLILEIGGQQASPEEKQEMAARKNSWYQEMVAQMKPDEVLAGARAFIIACKADGLGVAIGSASKNAKLILAKTGLTDLFDAIIDGNATTRSKPDPEVFELAAAALSVKQEQCVVFEDAPKGVDAANALNMLSIGVGNVATLGHADAIISDFEGFTLGQLYHLCSHKG